MAKKKNTPEAAETNGVLITTAKVIGKAVGQIASVVRRTPNVETTPNEKVAPAKKRPAAKKVAAKKLSPSGTAKRARKQAKKKAVQKTR
jgi:hypothetical protein